MQSFLLRKWGRNICVQLGTASISLRSKAMSINTTQEIMLFPLRKHRIHNSKDVCRDRNNMHVVTSALFVLQSGRGESYITIWDKKCSSFQTPSCLEQQMTPTGNRLLSSVTWNLSLRTRASCPFPTLLISFFRINAWEETFQGILIKKLGDTDNIIKIANCAVFERLGLGRTTHASVGGQTEENLRWRACKFDRDLSERK